ncbi:hypothetical protein C8R44DRAFT_882772 [Mycena epipterygia]|nr:hypothetical protein C8R44DRAFT_882772 [Mycena epipterygia]
MDDEPLSDAHFTSDSIYHPEAEGATQSTPGAMYDMHFVVTGGNFTGVTKIKQAAPTVPTDFRVIPMGDLALRSEIRLNRDCVMHRRDVRHSVRRIYSARIHGCNSKMTVAVYQGDKAEETVHKLDLVPAKQMLEKYCDSPILTVCLWGCIDEDFWMADEYFNSMAGIELNIVDHTKWIRPETGRLCIDLIADAFGVLPLLTWDRPSFRGLDNLGSLLKPQKSSKPEIIASISFEDYHRTCAEHLSKKNTYRIPIATHVSVKLGTLIHDLGPEFNSATEIACLPDCIFRDCGWEWVPEGESVVMENGWTRKRSWDGSVYSGLRQFHECKGFDPYTQDVAHHLEYPLLQFCPGLDTPFARMKGSDGPGESATYDDVPSSNEAGDGSVYDQHMHHSSSAEETPELLEAAEILAQSRSWKKFGLIIYLSLCWLCG